MRKFSMGESVVTGEGESRRHGVVVECDVPAPAGAGDKSAQGFYRVKFEDGSAQVCPESEIEPSDQPPEKTAED